MKKQPAPVQIPVGEIDSVDRLRDKDDAAVDSIALLIERHGLLNPIQVQKPRGKRYRLIAGYHRLWACHQLGLKTIPATVLDVTDDEARMIEIAENVGRSELNKLERARFACELRRIWVATHAKAGHGGDRRSADFQESESVTWSEFVVARTGISRTQIELAATIGERLDPDAADMLRATKWADNQAALLALCTEKREGKTKPRDYAAQRRAAKLLTDANPDKRARTVAEALGVAGRASDAPESKSDSDQMAFERLWRAWHQAPGAVKRRFVQQLLDDEIIIRTGAAWRLRGGE